MSNEFLGNFRVEGQKFKELVKETFDAHCEAELYTLELHSLDHVVEELDLFGSLELLNSAAFA